jgi:hypothetical protein
MVTFKLPPNARINPPPDDTTQATSQDIRLMKGKLRAVGLNELLDILRPIFIQE